jgi:hypothetical protein
MGRLIRLAEEHAQSLKDRASENYFSEGSDADINFAVIERQKTLENAFAYSIGGYKSYAAYLAAGGQSADELTNGIGGRQFAGYRSVYKDLLRNADMAVNEELNQRVGKQQAEWQNRALDLQDKYDEWEKRTNAIFDRAVTQWGTSDAAYLSSWRLCMREYDDKVNEDLGRWETKIEDHYTNYTQWELNVRKAIAEGATSETLSKFTDDMNSQIAAMNASLEKDIPVINRTAEVNEAVAQALGDLPKIEDLSEQINGGIAKFSTRMALTIQSGANMYDGIRTVAGEFAEEMKQHQANMQTFAVAKMVEEYAKMLKKIKENINQQDEGVRQQTHSAALSAGFTYQGGQYVKKGRTDAAVGVISPYKSFETDRVFAEQMAAAGLNATDASETGIKTSVEQILKDADPVEAEAFFYVKKLAVSTVMDKIMGRAKDSEVRQKSTNAKEIGLFGVWVGRASDSTMQQILTKAAGNSASGFNEKAYAIEAMSGGFGELGAFGKDREETTSDSMCS